MIGFGASITGLLTTEHKFMQRLCLTVVIMCVAIGGSCLLYKVWQL